LGRGIWGGNLLSAYIFFLAEESNELLGLTAAASGLAMTLFVMPSGWLSDRFRRDYVIRIATLFGFLGIFFVYIADDILGIFIALVIWGAFQGMWRPSTQALFADSVESGRRSRIYALQHMLRQVGMAAGPFLNVGLFLILGDTWELEVLRAVILVGLLLSIMGLLLMWLVSDDRSLGAKSEAIALDSNNDINRPPGIDSNPSATNDVMRKPIIILLACNLIIGMGAGMTIRFFPIFFYEIYGWLPIALNLLMGVAGLATAVASLWAQRISHRHGIGRVWMIFIVQGIAIICLIGLIFYPPVLIVVPIFIVRQALMNASQPLSRSILMDHTPRRHRGIVNSAQAMAWGLFWNMSAALGGFLIGMGGYRLCFAITAGVYILGTIPILLLIPYVPRETGEKASSLLKKDIFPSKDAEEAPIISRSR
ncbi:MAG: MFS transporter, partial [Candidatus Hodarchaeota archaeon]